MKLAEALADRADLQKRLQQVTHRAQQAARYQEGETPAEDVNELLAEGLRLASQIMTLVVRINKTNSETVISYGGHEITLTAAIAMRDEAQMKRKLLADAAEAAAGSRGLYGYRRSRTELVDKTDLDIRACRVAADEYARRHREIDTAIQQANWNAELL